MARRFSTQGTPESHIPESRSQDLLARWLGKLRVRLRKERGDETRTLRFWFRSGSRKYGAWPETYRVREQFSPTQATQLATSARPLSEDSLVSGRHIRAQCYRGVQAHCYEQRQDRHRLQKGDNSPLTPGRKQVMTRSHEVR